MYRDAEKSTGIQKPKKDSGPNLAEMPAQVKEGVEENMEDYKWLAERRCII